MRNNVGYWCDSIFTLFILQRSQYNYRKISQYILGLLLNSVIVWVHLMFLLFFLRIWCLNLFFEILLHSGLPFKKSYVTMCQLVVLHLVDSPICWSHMLVSLKLILRQRMFWTFSFSTTISNLNIPEYPVPDSISNNINDPILKSILKHKDHPSIKAIEKICKLNILFRFSNVEEGEILNEIVSENLVKTQVDRQNFLKWMPTSLQTLLTRQLMRLSTKMTFHLF